MYLKDISITTLPNSMFSQMGINTHTICIEDMYLRSLMPFPNDSVAKVNVFLIAKDSDEEERFGDDLDKVMIAMDVAELYEPFDFNQYRNADDQSKKMMILETLNGALMKLGKHEKWELNKFEAIKEKLVQSGLEDKFYYKEGLPSKNRQLRVSILFEQDLELLKIWAEFSDKDGGMVSKKLILEREPEAMVDYYFGKVKWKSDSEVLLFDRSGKMSWSAKL